MKIVWLLFFALAGETDDDEPGMSLSIFEDRVNCERAGAEIEREFDLTGGGAVRRNEDGTFCRASTISHERDS